MHHFVPNDLAEPYIYEATRDMLLEHQDLVITQFGALLFEIMDGGNSPLLRTGAVVRDRNALRSGDGHTAVGGMLMYRHADKPASPVLVLLGFGYLVHDFDRVGEPNIQFQAVWMMDKRRN